MLAFLDVLYFMVLGIIAGVIYTRWLQPHWISIYNPTPENLIKNMQQDVYLMFFMAGAFYLLFPSAYYNIVLIYIGQLIYMAFRGIDVIVSQYID